MNNPKITLRRLIYMIVGSISFLLGTIGIIIPGLPTTPFMILSSILFLKSSDKLYFWLTNHKTFGKYVTDFKEGKGISKKVKIYAQTMMLITISFSLVPLTPMYIENPLIRILLLVSGGFSFWLVGFKIPTKVQH